LIAMKRCDAGYGLRDAFSCSPDCARRASSSA
jgi:hypothetical protein